MQETWVRAVRKLPGFRWESELATWLCAILIRHCRERWREHERSRSHPIEDANDATDDTTLISVVDRLELTRTVHALPDGYRQILVLHDVEGYTHEEIAQLTGIQIGTSKSQLSRARCAIRRMLAGESSHNKRNTTA